MLTETESQVRYAPTGDRIIVRRVDNEGRSKGGVFLPQTFKDALSEGVVIASGPGRRRDDGNIYPPPFFLGQVVLYHESSALSFDRDADDQVMLSQDVVIGVKCGS